MRTPLFIVQDQLLFVIYLFSPVPHFTPKLTMPDVPSPVSRALEQAMITDPAKMKSRIIQGGGHDF